MQRLMTILHHVDLSTYARIVAVSDKLKANPHEKLILGANGRSYFLTEVQELSVDEIASLKFQFLKNDNDDFVWNRALDEKLKQLSLATTFDECPINQSIMIRAATTTCGHTFEGRALSESQVRKQVCPMCRADLASSKRWAVFNHALNEFHSVLYNYKQRNSDVLTPEELKIAEKEKILVSVELLQRNADVVLENQKRNALKIQRAALYLVSPQLRNKSNEELEQEILQQRSKRDFLDKVQLIRPFAAILFYVCALAGAAATTVFAPYIGIPLLMFVVASIACDVISFFTGNRITRKLGLSSIVENQLQIKIDCAQEEIVVRKKIINVDIEAKVIEDYKKENEHLYRAYEVKVIEKRCTEPTLIKEKNLVPKLQSVGNFFQPLASSPKVKALNTPLVRRPGSLQLV